MMYRDTCSWLFARGGNSCCHHLASRGENAYLSRISRRTTASPGEFANFSEL